MPYRTLLDEFNETGEIPAGLKIVCSFRPIETAPEPQVTCPSCGRRTRASETFDIEPPGVPPPSRMPDSIRERIAKGRRPVSRWICDQCFSFTTNIEIEESGGLGDMETVEEIHTAVRAAKRRNADRIGGGRPEGPPGLERPWTPGYRRADDHADGKGPPEIDPRGRNR